MVAQISIILQLDYIKSGVIYFFIGSEALSILENATICGVVSPEWLKKINREWHGKVGESPIDSGGTGDSGSTG
jgi:phage-related holin